MFNEIAESYKKNLNDGFINLENNIMIFIFLTFRVRWTSK